MSMNGVKVVYICEYCGKTFKEVEPCRQCAKRCKEAKESGKTIVVWRKVVASIDYDYCDYSHYINIHRCEPKTGFILDGDYTRLFESTGDTSVIVDRPCISDLTDTGVVGILYQIQGHTKFVDDEALKEALAEAFKDKLKEVANEI